MYFNLVRYAFNKYSLLLYALIIIFFSLWYTNQIASVIKEQEISQANELANAYMTLNSSDANEDELEYVLEKIKNNNNIPVLWTDANQQIIAYKNFDDAKINANENYLENELNKISNNKIEIKIDDNEVHYLYYKDSQILQKIKKYPYYQLFLVLLFFLISFIAFSSIRKAEQNQVWVGLAKETAHQLGTPISSLSAWIEILKDKLNDEDGQMMVNEMHKDLDRLYLVANRFSKIGSVPELNREPILPVLERVIDYMKKRAAYSIVFQLIDATADADNCYVNLNTQLFEWVLENLLKNALDAMDKNGKISLIISDTKEAIFIDVKDTGKGIPTNHFEKVFDTGFSTKKRGWGLGLALSKRIVEEYHNGKIFVKESTLNKGTTFRIVLKKCK
jgi:two-component sensor histidine kinase